MKRNLLMGFFFFLDRFNPIAITYLRRAVTALLSNHLSTISKRESVTSRSIKIPSKDFIDMLLENAHGDIRSAIMTLQFACVVDLPGSDLNTRKKGEKLVRKKAAKEVCVLSNSPT